jgi:hypothetical protein
LLTKKFKKSAKKKIVNLIQCRKWNWIGHIVRGEGILKEVLEGRMERKRRGRPRNRMLDELIVSMYEKKVEKREVEEVVVMGPVVT